MTIAGRVQPGAGIQAPGMDTEPICRVCGVDIDYSLTMTPGTQKWCSLACMRRPDPIPVLCLGFEGGAGAYRHIEVYHDE